MKKLVAIFLVELLLATQTHAASGVISGAIRWDAWYENTVGDVCAQAQTVLNPLAWQARAPWFAQAAGDYGLTIVGSQANMDSEIGYAHGAGLKFWAFVEYPVGDPSVCLRQAWTLYQASSAKANINWTWISDLSDLGSTGNYSSQVAKYVSNFQDPQWQTVSSGRPLWFILWDGNFASHWGSSYANVAAMITALRAAALAASLGNPYIVVLNTNTNITQAVQEASGIGADAAGSYGASYWGAYVGGLVTRAENSWTTLANTGFPVVPTAVVGWSPAPFFQQPQSWYDLGNSPFVGMNEVTIDGSVTQVANHIQDGVTWVQGHASADPSAVLLIYAWDECAEGGGNMLIPTVGNPPPSSLLSALSGFLP